MTPGLKNFGVKISFTTDSRFQGGTGNLQILIESPLPNIEKQKNQDGQFFPKVSPEKTEKENKGKL